MSILSIFKRLHTLSDEDFEKRKNWVFQLGQRGIDVVTEDFQYLLGELVDREMAERAAWTWWSMLVVWKFRQTGGSVCSSPVTA